MNLIWASSGSVDPDPLDVNLAYNTEFSNQNKGDVISSGKHPIFTWLKKRGGQAQIPEKLKLKIEILVVKQTDDVRPA